MMSFVRTGLTLCIVLAGLMVQTGCKPPETSDTPRPEEGRVIVTIPTKPPAKPAHQVVEIDGVEYLQARGEVGRSGGTFYDAGIGEGPKTFNPWVSKDGTSSQVSSMFSAGLTTNDAYTGRVIPYLAKSVKVSPDKTTYTVTLRKGLTWSDGHPLTSKDVVFTWNNIIKPGLGNASLRDLVLVDGEFPAVRALDDVTIEFKTVKPFVPFKRRLGYDIAPAHILEPVVKKGTKAFDAAWRTSEAAEHPEHLIGAGMWILESYDPTMQRITYRRNPKFHMVDKLGNHLPYLDRYVLNFVNDMNNMQLQFEQGKMDVYPVPGQYVSHVRKLTELDFDFNLYNLGPSDNKTFLFFNLNTRKDPETGKRPVDPVKSAWFNNVYFRQAVDWAINRQDIVANILKGVGQAAYTAESPVSPFVHEHLSKGHPRDLEKAKELLLKGGFQYNDKGKLLDANGHPVEFELLTNSGNDQREYIGNNLVEDLAELGITVNFKTMEFNVLIGRYDTGSWEASIMGLGGGSPLEPHDGVNVWRSDGALHMFNQRKPGKSGHVDLSDRLDWEKKLDDIFEQGAQTFDPKKRRQLYHQYQEIVYRQQPFIYLVSPLRLYAVNSRFRNLDPTPLGGMTHNMEELWLAEDDTAKPTKKFVKKRSSETSSRPK